MSARAKRRLAIGLSAGMTVAILAVGGYFVIEHLRTTTFGPQHEVEGYLQALVDGRAGDAVAILDPNVISEHRVLLADDIYKAATDRPTGYAIGKVSFDKKAGTATVGATVTQDGKRYPVTFGLDRDGKTNVVFDTWKVTSGPTDAVLLELTPSTLTVNGIAVDNFPVSELPYGEPVSKGSDWDHTLPVLPGTYTFSAPGGTRYWNPGDDVTITVTPGTDASSNSLRVSGSFTDAVTSDAEAIVTKALDACVAPTEIYPTGCEYLGYEDPYWAAMTDITRRWAYGGPDLSILFQDSSGEWSSALSAAGPDAKLYAAVSGSIRMDYKVRDNPEDDWTDKSRYVYLSDPDSSSDNVMFPITIDGDTLKVDTSALQKAGDADD